MSEQLIVYGPDTALCNSFGSYKGNAGPEEYGVATGPHECANGGYAYYPVVRYTRGTAARNKAAAERYLALRKEGRSDTSARAVVLSEYPPGEKS
jgi:hypothetical protein